MANYKIVLEGIFKELKGTISHPDDAAKVGAIFGYLIRNDHKCEDVGEVEKILFSLEASVAFTQEVQKIYWSIEGSQRPTSFYKQEFLDNLLI